MILDRWRGVWFLKIPVRNFRRPESSKLESDLLVADPFEKRRKMMPGRVGMSRGSLRLRLFCSAGQGGLRRNQGDIASELQLAFHHPATVTWAGGRAWDSKILGVSVIA